MFIGAKWSGKRTRLSEFKRLRGPPGVKLMWIASYLSVLLCAWIQFASATGGLITKNTWWGVLIPRHFLGRLLSLIMTGLISFWLMVVKSLLFGWYWPKVHCYFRSSQVPIKHLDEQSENWPWIGGQYFYDPQTLFHDPKSGWEPDQVLVTRASW